VVRPNSARIVPLTSKTAIDATVSTYLKAVKSKQDSSSAAKSLYDLLIAPVHTDNVDDILIVRDGVLNLVPFDAVVSPQGGYLGDNSVVSYLPSAGSVYLFAHQSHGPTAQKNLFAVGNVPYTRSSDSSITGNVVRGINRLNLPDLPTSGEEVVSAAAAFDDQGTTLLTGSAATKVAVKRAALSNYRVLHFAVHGVADETHPDQAALVFLSDPANREDGLLSAPEVAQLRLRANLVVLSACDTAIGQIEGQEGIADLSRAFLLAGARSVISSLWAVDDEFSLALLKRFYEEYRRTSSPALSLAIAKRHMLERFGKAALPYYWAAFTFEGVPESAIKHYD
jgi:CHAT domain-containing protein